ncbi:MAG TPA: VIT domain-containing protein [Gemmatimonadaceae bacterium]|nr:VIT domain-containing protein [Gemmatimonadaceae bacterium]
MRSKLFRRLELALPLVFVVLSTPGFAQGWIVPRPCGFGIMPVEGRPTVAPPIRECRQNIVRTRSDVRVELADRVLRYEVEERFVNRGGLVGEADYLFPLPANAAFQDLKLSINGELVSGETMNAGQARGIYESIVRAQRDPALVEWMGHGLLRARIFPINPGEEKRIVVRFQSVASREGDALRIDYFRGGAPGTTNVRDDGSNSFTLMYRATPELGTPYSPTHQLDVHNNANRTEVAVRGDAKDVTLLVPAQRGSTAAISTLAYAPGNEDAFALITVTPPAAQREEAIPRDITLVLDVSGSMSGRKIEQARAAGRQLLATLRPADRFRLIDFSSDVRTFQNDFVSATDANVRQATRYLDALDASGGTNIEGALREAMRPAVADGRLPIILFLTDGEPTIGETQPDRLATIASDANARARESRRIFTFGLGSDVNVSLLETLALEGRGTSQFVRPDESVERMVGIVADRLVGPVLTDVRIRVEGDPRLSRMLPGQPSDLFADHDLVALARYSGHGQARVIVEGNRRGTPVRWTSTVDFPDRERDNQFVARLWAAQRVGYLSAEKRKRGASQEIDEEIRTLGERYGIPTEFTSYLVTEPSMVANRRGVMAPASAAGAMAPVAEQRFEMAKAASAQRAVASVAVVDSMKAAATPPSADMRRDAATMRRIDARTFTLRDGVWTDARFRTGMETIIIKPYSKAYFDLVSQFPELRSVYALGNRVIVVGKSIAISLDESKGASELTAALQSSIARGW